MGPKSRHVLLTAGLILSLGGVGLADFPVSPYLQNPSSDGMVIAWESNNDQETWIDFGTAIDQLDQSTSGSWVTSIDGTHLHHVSLTGLSPQTRYYYRARTETEESTTAWFTTASAPDSESTFLFAAYSDAEPGQNPEKHAEIVNDGILEFFNQPDGGVIDQVLAFCLVPGDLVGPDHGEEAWRTGFFSQAEILFRHVPLIPAPGSGEASSPRYLDYMNLPLNGTPGFEEQWYWFDRQNLRIITLDSTSPDLEEVQLEWLDDVLEDAASQDQIDFVLLQLHHPCLSESWPEGESDFACQAVDRVAQFSSDTGKPSVHFHGRAHSYSRGHARDHRHVMINTASAMGDLDYWYARENHDRDEILLTEPEWGFCVVQIKSGYSPRMTIKRYSRGNDYIARDNELRDEIVISRNNQPPNQPVGLSPTLDDGPVQSWNLEMSAGNYADPDGDEPVSSHWQISDDEADWTTPLAEEWKQRQNWYRPSNGDGWYSENIAPDPNITQVDFESSVPGCSSLYWRVRYRDNGLQWSNWSDPVAFTTGDAFDDDNGPSPADGETGVPHAPVLSWGSCNQNATWSVYLSSLPELDSSTIIGIVDNPEIQAPPLVPWKTYYWRVDAAFDGQVVTGPIWSFTTDRPLPTDWSGEWRFIDADPADEKELFAARGTSVMRPIGMEADIDWSLGITGSTLPHIDGTPATYLRMNAVAGAERGMQLKLDPPGNGNSIEQFTFIFDLYIESDQAGRVPIWQSADSNDDEPELHLNCDTNGFLINGTAVDGENLWPRGEWFRLSHRVDMNTGESELFINGALALSGLTPPTPLSGGSSGLSTWLFSDDDDDTGLIYCSSVALVDARLADHHIADLETPHAMGIFLDRPTEWRFNDLDPGDEIPFVANFGTAEMTPVNMTYGIDWVLGTSGVAVPDMNGQEVSYVSMDNAWGNNRGLELYTNMPGNAGLGCCTLGHYTLIWDLFFNPSQLELQPLWQADPNNSDNAEFFVDCGSGGFYTNGNGSVAPDSWPINQWFRIAQRVDHARNTSTVFVNGVKVADGLDATEFIYGGQTDLPMWLLSDDGEFEDVELIQCSATALIDRLLSDEEIIELGGPEPDGIFDTPPGEPCPQDVNDDDVVNVTDLLLLINDWGICTGCTTDIDGNGLVNVNDLLDMVGAWGDC
ncbi:MAG: hypothetical protein CMJ39_11370 [Phycisphaerae bacterium]|nr:hypothetical protein [Phycisphaerae bacterium]